MLDHETKRVLTLNKAIYVGFSILDLSKYSMYKFHYSYIKGKFDANCCLPIHSLVYEIKTEDVYEDFYQDKNLFDSLNSKFFDPVNRKVIGR